MRRTDSPHATEHSKTSSHPETGLTPGRLEAPALPQVGHYLSTGETWLEISQLNVEVPILHVPYQDGSWDVSRLSHEAGYLEGTAFPTRIGNTALTGHAYLANGARGPFFRVIELRWGDEVVIRGFGYRHIYEVRHIRFVRLKSSSLTAYRHQDWITLLTCKESDKDLDPDVSRMGVQAVLNRVIPD